MGTQAVYSTTHVDEDRASCGTRQTGNRLAVAYKRDAGTSFNNGSMVRQLATGTTEQGAGGAIIGLDLVPESRVAPDHRL